jgi:hypothetical protein
MALPRTHICDPRHNEAKEWYDRYWKLQKLKGPEATWYKWRYEYIALVGAAMVIVFFCGPGLRLPWWLYIPMGIPIGRYVGWMLTKTPRIERKYQLYVRKRDILKVPTFLWATFNRDATRLELTDWDEYEVRRFDILRDVLAEASPWISELDNDCGCRTRCGHTNRLSRRVRDQLRRRVKTTARRKLELAAHDHAAAIEANRLRLNGIRGALKATPTEDD